MDIASLVHDPSKVIPTFKESGDCLITLTGCKTYIPVRFQNKGLIVIEETIQTVLIWAVVVDNKYYAVEKVMAYATITPSSMSIVKIGDEDYYEFTFDKGSTVIPDINLVKRDTLVYRAYDEITAQGNYPWYIAPDHSAKLYLSAKKHGGINLASNNATFELIAATTCRSSSDMTKFYRHSVDNIYDPKNTPHAYVALTSVMYGANNTVSRLMGAYYSEGVTAALVYPSTELESVEKKLRT